MLRSKCDSYSHWLPCPCSFHHCLPVSLYQFVMTNCRQGKNDVAIRQTSPPCCLACADRHSPASGSSARHCACVDGAPVVVNEVLCYVSGKLRNGVPVSSFVDTLVLWNGFSNSDLTTAAAVILNLTMMPRLLIPMIISRGALQSQEFVQLTIKSVFVAASLDKLPPASLTPVAPHLT